MNAGYTPTTDYELLRLQRNEKVAELTAALGGYDKYLEWANGLTVDEHLNVVKFIQLVNEALEAIEVEAAEIVATHFIELRNRALESIK